MRAGVAGVGVVLERDELAGRTALAGRNVCSLLRIQRKLRDWTIRASSVEFPDEDCLGILRQAGYILSAEMAVEWWVCLFR